MSAVKSESSENQIESELESPERLSRSGRKLKEVAKFNPKDFRLNKRKRGRGRPRLPRQSRLSNNSRGKIEQHTPSRDIESEIKQENVIKNEIEEIEYNSKESGMFENFFVTDLFI